MSYSHRAGIGQGGAAFGTPQTALRPAEQIETASTADRMIANPAAAQAQYEEPASTEE
jgi:hypothetical protein